ncbi:MAG: metallophosphoesterase [Thermodesulfobacteriota bacterium]
MIRVLHVSDLHFHKNQSNNEQLKLTDKIFKAGFGSNDYLLLTGDITDDGDKGQFREATNAVQAFSPRILAVPGNHDYGPVGNFYSESCARYFDNVFCKNLNIPAGFLAKKAPAVTLLSDNQGTEVVAIGLNSNSKTSDITDFARGEVGETQLKALDKILTDARYEGKPKLVYLHHRPQPCSVFLALNDYEDLMSVVHNRVDVLCFGHSGGDLQKDESTAARVMAVREKPYGVRYLLNANSSVAARKYFEITFDQGKLKGVTIK